MNREIVTHAIIDARHDRSFHVPVVELDRYVGFPPRSSGEWWPPVVDVSGGRPLDVPEEVVERGFQDACERMKLGGSAVYTHLRFSRADVERLWPARQPEPDPHWFHCDLCKASYSRVVEAGHRAACLGRTDRPRRWAAA